MYLEKTVTCSVLWVVGFKHIFATNIGLDLQIGQLTQTHQAAPERREREISCGLTPASHSPLSDCKYKATLGSRKFCSPQNVISTLPSNTF